MTYDDDDLPPENSTLEISMRRGISRYLTEEGALPICEQCNASGSSGPVQIVSSDDLEACRHDHFILQGRYQTLQANETI